MGCNEQLNLLKVEEDAEVFILLARRIYFAGGC